MSINLQRSYQEITKKTIQKIELVKDFEIMGSQTNELADYFFSLDFFSPVEVDSNKLETAYKETGFQIPENSLTKNDLFDNKNDFTTEAFVIKIPIKPNHSINGIMQFQPFKNSKKEIQWADTEIKLIFNVKGFGFIKTETEIETEIKERKQVFYNWIESINKQIINLNEHLRSDIIQCIEKRKREIELNEEKYRNICQRINVQLVQKTDAVIEKIQLYSSPLIERIKPSPTSVEEYVLDKQKVLDIIHVLDNQGRQFEKTAITYKSMGEEDLRNILLVNLNAIFEGKAVGEAFSNKGKTDIYLNIDKGNILVAECKIWSGKKGYQSAINQLLDYLTWRNNFGIIITFCKKSSFSNILNDTSLFLKEQNFLNKDVTKISESHFISHHKLPSDEFKNVEIHHVFYNLYTK